MHKLSSILGVLMLSFFLSCAQSSEPVSKLLSQEDFIAQINKETSVQIIDVRSADEFAAGHIEGAKNFDFYGADFDKQLKTLDLSKPVYVYCAAGGRSGKTCKVMEKLGFTRIYDLQGGYHHE